MAEIQKFARGGTFTPSGPIIPVSAERPGGCPLEPPIAIMVSRADRDHQAAMRRRSYELAVERGHVRR